MSDLAILALIVLGSVIVVLGVVLFPVLGAALIGMRVIKKSPPRGDG